MPNIELTMYQISQVFLLPTLVLIAALFLYAFWVLGEFLLLALYRPVAVAGCCWPITARIRH